ncbi:MAG: phosphate acetyltransferase [Candidatus Latescibacteria bacterium]|nr:phosphate acetyltransferase [Candidatus Latescibacterota bacterium]
MTGSRLREDALEYHSSGRRGKIEVVCPKPFTTQRDLSLAYTPGVAEPCREIHRDPDAAYLYTARGNLVAVVTNGSAVLGLGDIGALAGKPVMEGKGVLFKRFADIDVFDIELNTHDPDEIINAVALMEPTFGGINLEDIKAPECFIIEQRLRERMNIPVFHDDQHGTAIITGAALLNALEIAGKRIEDVKIVYNGAGGASVACARLHEMLGVRPRNIVMCDSKGVLYRGRTEGMNPYKAEFAADTDARTLAEAMAGADVFIGLSVKDVVNADMVRSMARNPIVFALANPDPEIDYETATAARSDVLMATGRSDYPNQVNNVLGFPYIFRGALDVRARAINEAMKVAAVQALAQLAKEDVPDSVLRAYGIERLRFGQDYFIPKPFDHRVLLSVAPAVAKAAMESGVARISVNLDTYRHELEKRLGRSHEIARGIIHKARRDPKRIVFPEGEHEKILRACQILMDEKIAHPLLLGDEEIIREKAGNLGLDLQGVPVVNPMTSPQRAAYAEELFRLRSRKGISHWEAAEMILNRNVYGSMMVHLDQADGLISGLTQHYPDTIRPALQIIETRPGVQKVSGLYVLIFKNQLLFLADTTVNIEPSAEDLAEIAIESARVARRFDESPRVAMLSFSNFGSTRHPLSEKVRRATEIIKERAPDLVVEGEMQADTAVAPEIAHEAYPFSAIQGDANVLIFPDLQSGNIAYKLLMRLGGAEAIGPILMGLSRPVHVLQRGCDVSAIVHMAAIAVVDAQEI